MWKYCIILRIGIELQNIFLHKKDGYWAIFWQSLVDFMDRINWPLYVRIGSRITALIFRSCGVGVYKSQLTQSLISGQTRSFPAEMQMWILPDGIGMRCMNPDFAWCSLAIESKSRLDVGRSIPLTSFAWRWHLAVTIQGGRYNHWLMQKDHWVLNLSSHAGYWKYVWEAGCSLMCAFLGSAQNKHCGWGQYKALCCLSSSSTNTRDIWQFYWYHLEPLSPIAGNRDIKKPRTGYSASTFVLAMQCHIYSKTYFESTCLPQWAQPGCIEWIIGESIYPIF